MNGQDAIGSPDNINKSNNYDNILGDSNFLRAFIASLSVIVVSELGDKTFFIAAIMAMRHPRLIVFAGAITALALMTVLSGNDYFLLLLLCFSTQSSLSIDDFRTINCWFTDKKNNNNNKKQFTPEISNCWYAMIHLLAY